MPVMAKTQIGTTWELATVPFVPVLDLLREKLDAFRRHGLRDGMLSWTLGSCPSVNWDLLREMQAEPGGDADVLLSLAARLYGRAAANQVRNAWKTFSDAFRTYPFSNSLVYSSFVLEGPAHRLYATPSGLPSRILNSFDNLAWTQPFGPDRVARLFRGMSHSWRDGVKMFEQAIPRMTEAGRERARRDLVVTEAAGLYFEAVALGIDFYQLRNRSALDGSDARQNLHAQARVAERFLTLCRLDSRIGFEASIGYVFLPLDVREKLAACRYLIGKGEGAPRA
jgi:hypothetical protein